MTEQDHIPAPSGHAPRLEAKARGFVGITIREPETGAAMHCENPVEVHR